MIRNIAVSAGKILLFLGLWALGISAATLSVVAIAGKDFYAHMGWRIAVELGGTVSAFLALVIVAIFVDRRGFSTLGFPWRKSISGLAGGTLIGVAIFCVPMAILMAQGYAHLAPDFSQLTPQLLGLALLLVFINVIDQELIVRSYLFQEIWKKYSGVAAVTVSTILFLALHAGPISKGTAGLLAGANILFASILLGIAYLRSGALWLPIGIHFGWNAFQGPVLGINVTGMDLGAHWHAFALNGPDLWTGGAMGVEGGLAGLAGPTLGIVLVMLIFRKPVEVSA